jgi:uncharacterized protein (DUF58 family)
VTRFATPRLTAYGAVTIIGFLASVAAGRAELAALAAPFALVLVAGLVLAEPPSVNARFTLDTERVIEGDDVTGRVTVAVSVPARRVELVVPLHGPATVTEPGHGELSWCERSATLADGASLRLTPTSWGVVRAGPMWVRVAGPLGLVGWQGGGTAPPITLRVLPTAGTMRTLLAPHEPRAVAGAHTARWRGDGFEFAEVRPFASGDRLRTVNWAVSARRDALWVNQRHPERAADLVLLLDTFADDRGGASPALVRAVRAAWLITTAHLAAHDRVGVVTFGGYPSWIAPGGGERAAYAICDRLLTATAGWTEAQRSVRILPRHAVPPGALVVAVTPLHDGRIAAAVADLRHRGMEVAVVEIDMTEVVAASAAALGLPDAAVRIWRLDRERRRVALAGVGIPIVTWPPDDDAVVVLDRLARARRRAGRRTASLAP